MYKKEKLPKPNTKTTISTPILNDEDDAWAHIHDDVTIPKL